MVGLTICFIALRGCQSKLCKGAVLGVGYVIDTFLTSQDFNIHLIGTNIMKSCLKAIITLNIIYWVIGGVDVGLILVERYQARVN